MHFCPYKGSSICMKLCVRQQLLQMDTAPRGSDHVVRPFGFIAMTPS